MWPLRNLFGQAGQFHDIHLEGQAAGLEGVAQAGALRPAAMRRFNHQQIQIRKWPRAPCGSRTGFRNAGTERHVVDKAPHLAELLPVSRRSVGDHHSVAFNADRSAFASAQKSLASRDACMARASSQVWPAAGGCEYVEGLASHEQVDGGADNAVMVGRDAHGSQSPPAPATTATAQIPPARPSPAARLQWPGWRSRCPACARKR